MLQQFNCFMNYHDYINVCVVVNSSYNSARCVRLLYYLLKRFLSLDADTKMLIVYDT